MPAGDRTGPWGLGVRTGRGMGYCAGYSAPGYMFPGLRFGFSRGFGRGFGRGLGRGFGPGRGRGFWNPWFGRSWGYPYFQAAPYPYSLENQAQVLEEQLEQVRARLKELAKAGKEKKDEE